jgi:hypothetical protein
MSATLGVEQSIAAADLKLHGFNYRHAEVSI